uniref:NADH-ubiquinone oxidoreductase chain 1 n=1 Tax=Trichuris discolor TaxID=483153 RepID=J7FD47_9BILA|nr:NADH dehydrogenase subunit 1 [Trichuris discolor]AFK81034.1 NADH dehydrogenase subunit 1 [Trichuris discolor]
MFLWFVQITIIILFVLIAVAFITLLERAYMGVSQRRRGPNKISLWGLFQPVLDGTKLMLKSVIKPYQLNFLLFSFIPSINLTLLIIFWSAMPYYFSWINFPLNGMFVIVLLGMMGFNIMITGWAANNKYALFGSLRSMTQSISYEIALSLVILSILCLKNSLHLHLLWEGFNPLNMAFSLILFAPVIIMILAECGRTPFDLLEAESELVSGYNVEYSSVEFAFLFMSEYGMIITLSIIFSIIISPLVASLIAFSSISTILFARYTYPRVRYDFLMSLMWKSLLPATILIWFSIFNISVT